MKAGIKKVDLYCFGFSEVNVSIALFKNTENKSITSIIMIKDKNKEVYTSPITEALELHFEAPLLDASITPDSVNSGYDNNWDLGSI